LAAFPARSDAHDASGLNDPELARVPVAAGGSPEPARFERLFREFAPYVLRVLPRMGVAQSDLDDVAQEVFFAVHRGLPGFEERSSAKTWIYGICIRTCSNYRQRAHRRREQLVDAPPGGSDAHSPERALVASRALGALDRALAQLPEAQRAVFVLFEIEQLAMNEIAEALGCPKFTAYGRLYAARRAVAAAMRKHAQRSGEP
jgi:RNA polymerase sigma-70 factor, ECF subfamily